MEPANKKPVVMAIAGFDPSGGAGVLADIKTMSAFGCYGVAAITSVTFQNTKRVAGARHQPAADLRRQASMLFDDFHIVAVKTGMLPTEEIVEEVARLLRTRGLHLVVDPVLESTSGQALSDDGAADALKRHLFPLSSIVTPNVAEAERLSGVPIRDRQSLRRAAEAIFAMGARAVLVTGGGGETDSCSDFLLDSEGTVVYESARIRSRHTHGTGCSLASAIACLLARGRTLRESVPIAKSYITEAILNSPQLGHGQGPLEHFPPSFHIDGC
jgi:hydroxymethylpyrimidine kinase/phosphomethylpyrimidine kinase